MRFGPLFSEEFPFASALIHPLLPAFALPYLLLVSIYTLSLKYMKSMRRLSLMSLNPQAAEAADHGYRDLKLG